MKNYIRRALKFIVYITLIFFLVLIAYPAIANGRAMSESFSDLIQNRQFALMFGLLMAYGLIYPVITFVTLPRHLNKPFSECEEAFTRALDGMNFIRVREEDGKIIYRRKSLFTRLLQWHEDHIVIDTKSDPVTLSGMRKSVLRINRLIDNYLEKQAG